MRISCLVFLVACGGGGDPAAIDAPGADSHDPAADAGPPPTPQVLVPSELGRVVDFAYTTDAIFPILDVAGRFQVSRCPQQAACTSPMKIGDAGASTRGLGVEVVGAHVYWLASDTVLMEAALDGSNAAVRFDAGAGVIEKHLRGDGTTLHFDYTPADVQTVAMALDTTTADPPEPIAGTRAADVSFSSRFDVANGALAVWRSKQGTEPQPIQRVELATGAVTPMGAATAASAVALASGGLFFVDGTTSHQDVHACTDSPCADSPPVASTFFQVAAAGDRGFFPGRTTDNTPTIVSCDLASAAAGTCTPVVEATPATELDLLDVRAIRVDATAIYVATDANGAGSLWRIPR